MAYGDTTVALFAGCPRSGKSTLARKLFEADIVSNGRPGLILDMERVDTFEDVPHADSAETVLRELYVHRRSVAYTPGSVEEAERAIAGVFGGKGVNVLIDEPRSLCNARYLSPALNRAARLHRHAGLVIRLVTQRLGDLHQDVLGVCETIYLFRLIAPADLDRAYREWGLDRERVGGIAQYEYVTHETGFPADAAETEVPVQPSGAIPPPPPAPGGAGTGEERGGAVPVGVLPGTDSGGGSGTPTK
jgi:hypothetical protein